VAKTLQVCHCGCTRRIILVDNVLYLTDDLLGFQEEITHIERNHLINGRWTFGPTIARAVFDHLLQPTTITKIDQ